MSKKTQKCNTKLYKIKKINIIDIMNKNFIIAGVFLFCLLALPFSVEAQTVSGNYVYVNNQKVYIKATPHTIKSSGWVYFDIMSKQYEGDIDVYLGFDSNTAKPKKIQYYKEKQIPITKSMSCPEPYVYNYTLSPNNLWCWKIENESYTLVFHKQFESANLNTRTVYWTEYETRYWNDLSEKVEKINYNHNEKDKWYYMEGLPIQGNKIYNLRVWVDVPVCFAGECENTGKYDFAIKPSGLTFSQAISQNMFLYLDPWWDSEWDYAKPYNITGGVSSYPVMINVSYLTGMKIDFGDVRFINNTVLNETLDYWIEYKEDGDYAVFWVEADDNGDTEDDFLMYWGNDGASTTSNFYDTFELGDNFDTDTTGAYTSVGTSLTQNSTCSVTLPNGENVGCLDVITGSANAEYYIYHNTSNAYSNMTFRQRSYLEEQPYATGGTNAIARRGLTNTAQNDRTWIGTRNGGDYELRIEVPSFINVTGNWLPKDKWYIYDINYINDGNGYNITEFEVLDKLTTFTVGVAPDLTSADRLYFYSYPHTSNVYFQEYIDFWFLDQFNENLTVTGGLIQTNISPSGFSINLYSPENKSYDSGNSISLKVDANDTVDSWWYNLNNEVYRGNTTFTPNTTISGTLPNGQYVITIYANDSSGTIEYLQEVFKVDTDIPILTVYSPQDSTYYSTSVPLIVEANEEIDTWFYGIDDPSLLNPYEFIPNTTMTIPNGTHIIRIYGNDTAGNVNNVGLTTYTVNIDTDKPQITVIDPQNDTLYCFVIYEQKQLYINTTADKNISNWYYFLNGSATNKSFTPFTLDLNVSSGEYIINIWADDIGGNTGLEILYNVTVDFESPFITSYSPSGSYNTTTVPLEVSNKDFWGGDEQIDTWWYSLNGGTNTTFTPNTTITAINGSNNIMVCANDTNCGYIACKGTGFIVDITEPEINIYSPEEKTYYDDEIIYLSVDSNQIIDVWWYSLNGGTNTTFTPNITITPIMGLNTITIYANNSESLIGQKTVDFTFSERPLFYIEGAFSVFVAIALMLIGIFVILTVINQVSFNKKINMKDIAKGLLLILIIFYVLLAFLG